MAVDDSTDLPEGTLVFAKLPGYPDWPAEIIDPDSDGNPPKVLVLPHADTDVLCLFFDEARQWCVRVTSGRG